MRSAIVFSLLLTFLTIPVYAQEQPTIIHAGRLMAVPGEPVQLNQTLLIKDGKINEIVDGFQTAEDMGFDQASIVDLRKHTVLPGLMDMHTHVTMERDPKANPYAWVTKLTGDQLLESLPFLERTLMAGFTTVRNVGADYKLILPLKRAAAQQLIVGPRIIAAAGGVSATGGHGDFHGYRPKIEEAFGNDIGICDGEDDCRRAVRALVKRGAEVIKITATGGVLSNTAAGVGQQLTDDELDAIVKAATSLGRRVAAHAHESDGINAALRAGVSSIEHGSYLNEESVQLFLENDAWLVPTLLAGTSVLEELEINEQIPPAIQEKIRQVGPQMESAFKLALQGGVKIAFGTDSGVSRHGDNAREFELMVNFGMDPVAAIRSATVETARLIDRSHDLGTLEEGKIADIIAVAGNPDEDISLLRSVDYVMKAGKTYKQ